MRIFNVEVHGFAPAIRGMRNPKDSWDKSDSYIDSEGQFVLGEADKILAQTLTNAGGEHCKFLRTIQVWYDIEAPRYMWSEFDTYHYHTSNSCSTMFTTWKRPLTINDFEHGLDLSKYTNKKEYFDVPLENIKEEWKDISGYEGLYQVSNLGFIKSLPRTLVCKNGAVQNYSGGILSQSINSSNYKKVVLKKDGHSKNMYVHRILALHFIPKHDSTLNEVNHKDGNKWNNNLSNLEWVTKSQNSKHAFDNNLRNISNYTKQRVANNSRILTQEDVLKVKKMRAENKTYGEIAKVFGCHKSVISNILTGKTYNDLELNEYDMWRIRIDQLNDVRDKFVQTKDPYWFHQFKAMLPEGFLQRRTINTNYAQLLNQYFQRKNHRLDVWREYCQWILTLPNFKELTGVEDASTN